MSPSLSSWRPLRGRSNSSRHDRPNELDGRWGDYSITAPTDGGWSQHRSYATPYHSSASPSMGEDVWVSPVSTLVGSSPEVGFDKHKTSPDLNGGPLPLEPPRSVITITIPLPWSKRSSRRARSLPPLDTTLQRRTSPVFNIVSASEQHQPPAQFSVTPVSAIHPHHDYGYRMISPVDTRSPQTRRMPSPLSAITPQLSALHILSPVVEDFGRHTPSDSQDSSSVVTPIEASPASLVTKHAALQSHPVRAGEKGRRSHSVPRSGAAAILPAHAAHQPLYPSTRARSTSRHSTNRRSPYQGPGQDPARNVRPATASGLPQHQSRAHEVGHRRHSRELATLTGRAPSRDRGTRRAHSSDAAYRDCGIRRDSGSTSATSGTTTTDGLSSEESDTDAAAALNRDKYYASRKYWHGEAGGGARGFYAHVVQDYKKIARDVEAEAEASASYRMMTTTTADYYGPPSSIPLHDEYEPVVVAEMKKFKVDEVPTALGVGKQELVPPDEELWG